MLRSYSDMRDLTGGMTEHNFLSIFTFFQVQVHLILCDRSHIMSPIESQIIGIGPVFLWKKSILSTRLFWKLAWDFLGIHFQTHSFISCLQRAAVNFFFSFKFSFWLKHETFMIKNRLSLFKNCIYAREGEVKVAHNEFWYIFCNHIPYTQIRR